MEYLIIGTWKARRLDLCDRKVTYSVLERSYGRSSELL